MKRLWLISAIDGNEYVVKAEFAFEAARLIEMEWGRVLSVRIAPKNVFRRSNVRQLNLEVKGVQ